MGWSFRVGRLAGINIYVHFTFLILLGFFGLAGYLQSGNPIAGLLAVGLIAIVFGIVVLHELGHALAARHFGIPTKDITLLPIGGVARLQRIPEKPTQELVVALAGPAVNVVLALLFGAIMILQDTTSVHADVLPVSTAGLVETMFWINVLLVGFNMLPAFPMDGGRVLRALLAMRMGASRATDVAAKVGKGMAILFAIVGIIGIPGLVSPNFMLLLIALFVWVGADAEARAMRAKSGLAGVPIAAVMVRRFAAVDPDDTLGAVASYSRQTFQRDFPVVVGGRVVGLIGREDVRMGLTDFGPDGRVFQVMHRDFPTVSPDDPAERGLALLSAGAPVVPVVAYGQLTGLLTPEHLSEFVRIGGRHWHEEPSDHEAHSRT